MHSGQQQALYHCPMHPTYVSDQAGDCPICGMTLVPVKPEEPHAVEAAQAGHQSHGGHGEAALPEGHAPVRITPQRQQLIGVKTEVIQRRALTKTISTVGLIAYDPDLYHAQEEYLAALKGFSSVSQSTIPEIQERAKKLVSSARLRLRLLGLNDKQIEQLAQGSGPDERLLLADGPGDVWLYGTLYEYEVPLVREGDPVAVEVRAFPGQIFHGTIGSIDTVLDPKTRSAKVRVLIPNPEGKLKPQMFANAKIQASLGEHLAVPESAVMDTGARQIVFVETGEGQFVPHEVQLGARAEGYHAVVEGLEAGQRVVTSGNFLIDSESRLRAASSAAASGHQH